ncbi:MAG: hypothetical protein BAJATHORv1_10062 [Candidatus Thorarchaeota archaeon]|nr:MAG: hypothetical protein BAJATHORv1_10062 [Candidatus Thorarchaeota archaeon]
MKEYILAITTCPKDESKDLADALVKSKKCACVNIIPGIKSIYHWRGSIETGEESILLMKTEKELSNELWDILKEHHSYEVPEFVIIPIAGGSEAYLKWISESVRNGPE